MAVRSLNGATFGERLRAARALYGFTQAQLASHLEMPSAHISHFECDRRLPSIPNLIRLCDALDVSADALLGR